MQHQVKQQLAPADAQVSNEDRATQSTKDAATNKRKKRRKKDFHQQPSEKPAKTHEVALNAENGHDNAGYAQDEDVDQEELENNVEDYREKTDTSNDVKNLYYNQLNEENQQKPLIDMMNIDDSRGSSTHREVGSVVVHFVILLDTLVFSLPKCTYNISYILAFRCQKFSLFAFQCTTAHVLTYFT